MSSGELWINSDRLGIFEVHRNLEHTGVFASRLHQESGCRDRELNPHPWDQQHNALTNEPPWQVCSSTCLHGNVANIAKLLITSITHVTSPPSVYAPLFPRWLQGDTETNGVL